MKPARETIRRKTPSAMTGFSRYFSQSVVALCASQMPPPRMGMERRKVTKFRMPTRLFEHLMTVVVAVVVAEEVEVEVVE